MPVRPEGDASPIAAEEISTSRLVLLPLRIDHADEMAVVLSDPELHTFIGGSPATAEQLRSRYTRWVAGSEDPAESWCNWVLRLRDENCLVGTVQASIGHADGGEVAEIAWVLGIRWQGRGLATEAARALVEWLDRQSVPTVIAHVHPDHAASAAVAAAAGLARTEHLQDGEVRWRRSR